MDSAPCLAPVAKSESSERFANSQRNRACRDLDRDQDLDHQDRVLRDFLLTLNLLNSLRHLARLLLAILNLRSSKDSIRPMDNGSERLGFLPDQDFPTCRTVRRPDGSPLRVKAFLRVLASFHPLKCLSVLLVNIRHPLFSGKDLSPVAL